MVRDPQLLIWRDDIDMVGQKPGGVFDLRDRHDRSGGQDRRHFAPRSGIEMHDDDEGCSDLIRKRLEKFLQRLYATRGSSDANDLWLSIFLHRLSRRSPANVRRSSA